MSVKINNLEKQPEFDDHRLVTFIYDQKTGLKGFIAIHRGGLSNPAFGATRLWSYHSESEALTDALKLSKLMTYKAALAGLKYGGGKAVLFDTHKSNLRNQLLKSYARHVEYLSGHFITGADVGISIDDLKLMNAYSNYMVGLRSDPVHYTVLGLLYGIEVAIKEVFGRESVVNRTFAIQGLGKTGMGLLKLIGSKAKKIYVCDLSNEKIKTAQKLYNNVIAVDYSDIHKQQVDVFCPCALSNALNVKTIGQMRCKIIAGSANNQLENSQVGNLLHKLGILYIPDYAINAGGLISVVDEYEHKNSNSTRLSKKVRGIKKTIQRIISASKRQKEATNIIADAMAEKIFARLD